MSIEKFGFFDSTGDDPREYSGADWLRFSRLVGRDGVRSEQELAISPTEMGLSVRAGYGLAMVDGQQYELYDDGSGAKELAIAAAGGSVRVDRVVLRLDRNTRTITMMVKQGSASAPELTRTDTVYELSLARVRVAVGAERLSESDITDERSDNAVCGIVQGLTASEAHALVEETKKVAEAASASADAANFTADAALSKAMNAEKTASQAILRFAGAHYWAFGPYVAYVSTDGWTYDEENDCYYKDIAAQGITSSMIPFVTSGKIGGAFPLCGCESSEGTVRIFLTDEPTTNAMITIYGLGVK